MQTNAKRAEEYDAYEGSLTTAEELWKLLSSSGYLNLSGKSPADFTQLRAAFTAAICKLHDSSNLGGTALVRGRGGLAASLTASRIYSGSYLLHHLAKFQPGVDRQAAKQALWGIYSGAHDLVLKEPDARWTIMYASDEATRWQQRSLLAFLRAHPEPDQTALLRFRLMECSCAAPGPPAPAKIDVGPGTPREKQLLVHALERTHPVAYVQALDLTLQQLELADCQVQMAAAGLKRRRCVAFARRGGRPTAAAVIEVGQEGLNLFHLYDSVRLYDLDGCDDAERAALLGFAAAWFQRQSKGSFVYYNEAAPTRGVAGVELRDLGLGHLCIMSRGLVPAYLGHIAHITGTAALDGGYRG